MEKILHQIANLLRKQNEHMIIGVSGHGGSGKMDMRWRRTCLGSFGKVYSKG